MSEHANYYISLGFSALFFVLYGLVMVTWLHVLPNWTTAAAWWALGTALAVGARPARDA